jgi:NDP-sugar pyrophosphorylase family protein
MNSGKLVILAGGISSRMRRPSSVAVDAELAREADVKSKSMIGVGQGNLPFMNYLLFNAREAGYTDIVLVVGERDHSVRSFYGDADRDNSYHGLTISYAVQPIPPGRAKPLGTADALWRALALRPDWHGQQFSVCNSDNLYSIRAFSLLRESQYDCAMIDYDRDAFTFDRARVEQFAVLVKNEQGGVVDIIEKPTSADVARARDVRGRVGVSMNLWRFTHEQILPFVERVPLHPVRLEKELPAAAMMMVRELPATLRTIPLSEHVPDLSSKEDLAGVQAFLARTHPDFSFGI